MHGGPTALAVADAPPRGSSNLSSSSRTTALLRLLGAVMAVLALTGQAAVWFALATVIIAVLLATAGKSILSCLPAGLVVAACLLVLPLLGCGLAGLPVLVSPATTRAFLLALTLVLVLVSERVRHQGALLAEQREIWVCLPALAVLGIGLWLSEGSLSAALGGLLTGWDNGPHFMAAVGLHQDGALSYADNAYPRGVHALIAVVVAAGHEPSTSQALLESFLRTQTLVIWTMYAALTAATAMTALRLASLAKLRPRTSVVVGVTAGLVMLTPGFLNFTVVFGFLTTIALALLLATAALTVVGRTEPVRTALVLSAIFAATAHSYQIGIPLVLLVIVLMGRRLAPAIVAAPVAAGACVLLLASAAPPFFAATQQVGISAVALPGAVAALPWLVLTLGITAALALGLRRRSDHRIRVVAAIPLATVAVAILISHAADASIGSYYPRKILWHATAASIPLVAACAGLFYELLRRKVVRVPVVRLSIAPLAALLLAVVAVFAVPGPYMATTGGWQQDTAPVQALLHPADDAAVCALTSDYVRRAVVHYMQFYGAASPWLDVDFGELPACPRPPTER